MKKLQVDSGAIKFVLAGANIMCPGLTSPGGALDDEVGAETPVAIMAEGKQHALAIGFTKMSAKDIRAVNKGIGVDNMHYLNNGLWKRTSNCSLMILFTCCVIFVWAASCWLYLPSFYWQTDLLSTGVINPADGAFRLMMKLQSLHPRG
ncbi:hypothetical protein EUGRSUZ_H03249 [Eucalyptus grandis]|uniref:Uncharacterized protein n=2 Tax=Eucalyptus grandis TaxID=71139 RepID=A0ACC3JY63_EUCGR|nr:hypothetical protein EUGRSUZ_H03249 [Eucalyptus grandis]